MYYISFSVGCEDSGSHHLGLGCLEFTAGIQVDVAQKSDVLFLSANKDRTCYIQIRIVFFNPNIVLVLCCRGVGVVALAH